MAKDTKITINLSSLDKLRKALEGKLEARVGIRAATGAHTLAANQHTQGKKSVPKGQGSILNVTLGIIQEFGSVSNKIPARSFLRMPLQTKSKELVKFLESPAIKKLIEQGKLPDVLKLLGVQGEVIVQEAFATGGFGNWAPNSPRTIAMKGSSAPLIDTGQLRRAVTSWVSLP